MEEWMDLQSCHIATTLPALSWSLPWAGPDLVGTNWGQRRPFEGQDLRLCTPTSPNIPVFAEEVDERPSEYFVCVCACVCLWSCASWCTSIGVCKHAYEQFYVCAHIHTSSRVCLCVQISLPVSVSHLNKPDGARRGCFSIHCGHLSLRSQHTTGICKTVLCWCKFFHRCKVYKVCSPMFVLWSCKGDV